MSYLTYYQDDTARASTFSRNVPQLRRPDLAGRGAVLRWTPAVVDLTAVRFLVAALTGWLHHEQKEVVAYLVEENRTLRAQLRGRRLLLTDDQRRRLAVRGRRLGRARLRRVATIVTPDTVLRWHRQLIARKWTDATPRTRRTGVLREIRQLVGRMADENPTWGYTRIRGALKHLGHCVGRSTIARILKAQGIPPGPERPTSWQTFLRAHWGAIAGPDFFTTEVWTWRGLVTYYTVFVIDLASRRVQIVGVTPHPDEAFMRQVGRTLTAADDGMLVGDRVLICDRDRKWSLAVRQRLEESGVRVVQTPFQAPNANAYAERFVRSIKHECLNQMIPFGERHLRRTLAEFVEHYHRERNHQGLDNELIDGVPSTRNATGTRRRQRLGGLLNYYCRAA
jgi:putative transposase